MGKGALLGLFVTLAVISLVSGHGRLLDPPSRSSLWRFGEFAHRNPPQNLDDNELFCGGFKVQYDQNGGKCGVCGDAWHLPQPRDNEGGGYYGRGILSRNYTSGQVIDILVELTASHKGYFEFRLCPNNNPLVPATEECLDRYVLELADGSGTQYPIPTFDSRNYTTQVKLPQGLVCSQCVLQWHYNTGNSWGECEDGTGDLGCGPQEIFRGCADVSIYQPGAA